MRSPSPPESVPAVAVTVPRTERIGSAPALAPSASARKHPALDALAEARWAVEEGRAPRLLAGLAGLVVAALFTAVLAPGPLAAHTPALLLVAVCAVAGVRGRDAGAVAGFVAGLSVDLFVATPLGLGAIVFTLLGTVAARFPVLRGDPHRRRAAAVRASAGAVVGTVLLGVAGRAFGAPVSGGLLVRHGVIALMAGALAGSGAFATVRRRRRS